VRSRPGKMRNMMDLRRRNSTLYEVEIPLSEPHFEHGGYIRANCRRGDWAQQRLVDITPYIVEPIPVHRTSPFGHLPVIRKYTRYAFANQQDAMMFKMRFGG